MLRKTACMLLALYLSMPGAVGLAVAVPPVPDDSAYTLEPGYRLDMVASNLVYPTSMTFDPDGRLHLLEAGFTYGPAKARARVLRLESDGSLTEVASGFRGPLTGIAFAGGAMYVADGGKPGRILRVTPDGRKTVVVDNLPTGADHYTSQLALGGDGKIYFGIGSVTNSAVVGIDNFLSGWLGQDETYHDLPSRNLTLAGDDFVSPDPLSKIPVKVTWTGAFVPFRSRTRAGQALKAVTPGNAAVYSVNQDGTGLTLFSDGLRNPFGLAFAPDGRLYTTVQGFDDRGSRPVANDPDAMWSLIKGGWYGWPDYASGMPVTNPQFQPEGKPQPKFVLAQHPPLAAGPVTRFDGHSAAMQFDFSRSPQFGYVGQAFVAQFGPLTPVTGTRTGTPGHRLVRVDPSDGSVRDFLVNLRPGPDGNAPERPICARFDPSGKDLYLLDFGVIDAVQGQMVPTANTGALWRVSRATVAQISPQSPAGSPRDTQRPLIPGVAAGTAATAAVGGAVLAGWWLYRRLRGRLW